LLLAVCVTVLVAPPLVSTVKPPADTVTLPNFVLTGLVRELVFLAVIPTDEVILLAALVSVTAPLLAVKLPVPVPVRVVAPVWVMSPLSLVAARLPVPLIVTVASLSVPFSRMFALPLLLVVIPTAPKLFPAWLIVTPLPVNWTASYTEIPVSTLSTTLPANALNVVVTPLVVILIPEPKVRLLVVDVTVVAPEPD